jgi:signal transduction histidine kinase
VTNAIKFTNPGGKVTISANEEENGNILFRVKDTGIGMPPEIVNNLFRIDVNVNRQGTNDEPSSGLGLILCKEFIEKHHGKIWAESEVGKGSMFCFTVPKSQWVD